MDEVTSAGSIAIDGQISANSSINTSNAMAGTLIAYGPFLGVCNFGSLTGTLDFRSTASGPINIESGNCGGSTLFAESYSGHLNVSNGDLIGTIRVFDDFLGRVSVSGQLNGEIRIDGSLVNTGAAEEIVIGGSVGPAGAVAIDWNGANDGDNWQSGAIVKVAGTPYPQNTPGLKLYEISVCRGDLDNDNDVDFFDIYPFVANLNRCVSDCEGGRAAWGSLPSVALDPQSLADNLLAAVAPERTSALLAAVDALADTPPAGSTIAWEAVRACMSGE